MQRNSILRRARVRDGVQTQPISHVGHLALGIPRVPRLRQPAPHPREAREGEAPLDQVALEDFHQTVRVRVVVDGTLHPRRPDEEQEVEQTWDLAHEVPRVLFGGVGVGVLRPF